MAKKRKLYQALGRSSEERAFSNITLEQWLTAMQSPLSTWSGTGTDVEEVIAQLGGAVKANGIVFALVLARAWVFSEARFLWRQYENGRPQDLFHTNELRVLERPWAGGTTSNLLTKMEFDASASGNAYIRRIPPRVGKPRGGLSILNPEWVKIVIGSEEDADDPQEAADAEVVNYIYDPPNGNRLILEPEEVAHFAPIPDPSFRFLGMSWITPVIEDVTGDQAQTIHKNRYFEHAATPNLIVKFDKDVSNDRIKEYAKIMDARHAGSSNAYKTMYIGGGADTQIAGSNFQEMDFAITQGKGEARLASASGVPPSWVGFSEGLQGSALNAGNFTAARRRFADGTMRPMWREAAASLETILKLPQGEGSHLWYDDRDIPFLREDKSTAAEVQSRESATIVNLVRDGFTPESVVAAVKNQDWDLLEFDDRFISVQLQALANIKANTAATEAETEATEAEDGGQPASEGNNSGRNRKSRKNK